MFLAMRQLPFYVVLLIQPHFHHQQQTTYFCIDYTLQLSFHLLLFQQQEMAQNMNQQADPFFGPSRKSREVLQRT